VPFRDIETYLEDILTSCEFIDDFLTGVTLEIYRSDHKTRSAVERQLQILTEAAFQLGDDGVKLCPTIDWRGIRGLGNALRHEYDDIDDEVIWQAIHDRLPSLKTAVEIALVNFREPRQSELP
jgi:uncharacterized protein with HEPN domain